MVTFCNARVNAPGLNAQPAVPYTITICSRFTSFTLTVKHIAIVNIVKFNTIVKRFYYFFKIQSIYRIS